ncbi:unnamed protein product [Rhizoctonia solani]|uniref:Protein kinase domain-containing protein n=1 Tax=Rhizoctonia solani TaxID=456999 RepID=A0A8H2WYZ0_9AGAM|nr:unnamed protein product [Rhizoctonia solani]
MNKVTSEPPDKGITPHKWTFLEVARHIKSHGLKKSLQNAGRTATPLLQRLERGISRVSESKPHPSPLGTETPSSQIPTSPHHAVPQPGTPSTVATSLKERSITASNKNLLETVPNRTLRQCPAESSVSHAGRTVSVAGSAVEKDGSQTCNIETCNTTGPGARDTDSSSVSYLGLPRDSSKNNDSNAEVGTSGDYKCRIAAPNQFTPEETSNPPSDTWQTRVSITSLSESTKKQDADLKVKIPHIGSKSRLESNEQVELPVVAHEVPSELPSAMAETDPLSNVPISRQMTADEVVSHLVKHGITDMSGKLDYSTFDAHPIVTGGSSDIYRGQLKDGTGVAVKVLRFSVQSFSETSESIRDAARELHTWSKCDHPNVLPLYGLVTFRSRIGMVSPWMSEGTMPCYLKANPKASRHDLARLAYLHEKGIIHGDLKGTNVLVSKEGTPVLTDFGNATLRDRTLKFTQAGNDSAFTVRWSAPEFIKDSGLTLRTKASDIYALGMTIYEAIVGKVPYYGETELQVIIMVAMKKIPPKRPDWICINHESGEKLWDLLTRCWSWEPEARPSVTEVELTMSQIRLDTP